MLQYKLTTLTNMLSDAKANNNNNNNKRSKNVLTYINKKKTWKGKNAMFRCYLAQVFDQVVIREHTLMNVFMFYHLVQWPLFPAEKMFKYFVSNDNGSDSGLSCNGFCDNVVKVYGAGVNELVEVLFDVLDFMCCGKICVEDVNMFFVHLHMVEQSAENEGMVYEIVKRFFNGKWEMTKEEYMDVVRKGNNDVVVLFYFYIARFCFYNTQAVEYYEREIYASSQVQTQTQLTHVNIASLSTCVDDDVKISECVLEYIELVLTSSSSSSSLHEDEDDNANVNGTTIINDDNNNNNNALLQELSDINNSEDDLSDLNRFEVQMKECMEKINPNKKPLKIIKSSTSSFFPSSSSSTTPTTAKTDTSTPSKATRSQFYNMFHHAHTTTTQSPPGNTNEFVFYMKETIFDTLDMLESSKKTVPISTNSTNTNNYNITSTMSNTTSSMTNLNDNNKIEQINKKIQFVRIKVYVFKNHLFTSLYSKDQSNKKNNTSYQNMYYFSSLCTYIKLTKAKFTYFNQIKYAINISHLFNCAPVNTVFYAEDEITARTFIALFSSTNQCESLRNDINERFIIGEDIGKGKFGIVKQGKERSHYTTQHTNNNNNSNHRSSSSCKNVAIKIVGKDTNIIESVFEINEWEKYIFKFLTKVNHPNIINAIALYEDESFIYYVYQYISNGTLKDYISSTSHTMTSKEMFDIFQQIISGVNQLHLYGIMHRDIKPTNILIDKTKVIKVIDFGLSIVMGQSEYNTRQCGSLSFKSPEILLGERYNFKTDVWSLGVTLYNIKNKRNPFVHSNRNTLKELIVNSKFPRVSQYLNKEILKDKHFVDNDMLLNQIIECIISDCLVNEQDKRLTTQELYATYYSAL